MKKIAILFIIIFALVQAAPVVMAVFTDVSSFFIADEEKGEEKTAGDIKEKNTRLILLFGRQNLQTA